MTKPATITAVVTAVLAAGCIAVAIIVWETEGELRITFPRVDRSRYAGRRAGIR